MTPAQQQLFWREWGAVCRAHGWNTNDGLHAFLGRRAAGEIWVSPALNLSLDTITELAQWEAADNGRNVTADDLRHAVIAFAVGHPVSSKALTNSQFDKTLALMRLLARPESLRAVMDSANPGANGAARRYRYTIQQAPAAYWRHLSQARFGHCDLDRLTLPELRQLFITIKNRPAARPSTFTPQPNLATP